MSKKFDKTMIVNSDGRLFAGKEIKICIAAGEYVLRITKIKKTYGNGKEALGFLIDQVDNKDIVVTREFGRDSIFLKLKGFTDD